MIEGAQDGRKTIVKNAVANQDPTPHDRGYDEEMKEHATEIEL